jgi:biopolymer transport protein ExbB
LVARSKSAEAAIVAAGLKQLARGSEAAAEAMASATALQRMRLERRLAFLGTLGNNAPFIGLLGTVIGIVQAFDKLQGAGASGGATGPASDVMGAISESLVATAIGLVVAIPAVAAFNYFQRRIRATLASSEALTHILLAYAKGEAAVANADVSHSGARRAAVREQPETFSMQRISTIPS